MSVDQTSSTGSAVPANPPVAPGVAEPPQATPPSAEAGSEESRVESRSHRLTADRHGRIDLGHPRGAVRTQRRWEPIPGTYHTVPPNPQKIVSGTLLAPISGTYGIQAADGSVSPYNSGTLYGAINVALFVLVIGGFLGITVKTGAVDAGIGALVKGLGTRGNLLIPILMGVFMLVGTTYGVTEESLAFCMLVIAAMIALGYDGVVGRGHDHARRGHGLPGFDHQPIRHRHRLTVRGRVARGRPRRAHDHVERRRTLGDEPATIASSNARASRPNSPVRRHAGICAPATAPSPRATPSSRARCGAEHSGWHG